MLNSHALMVVAPQLEIFTGPAALFLLVLIAAMAIARLAIVAARKAAALTDLKRKQDFKQALQILSVLNQEVGDLEKELVAKFPDESAEMMKPVVAIKKRLGRNFLSGRLDAMYADLKEARMLLQTCVGLKG
jgi:hypothetical protein